MDRKSTESVVMADSTPPPVAPSLVLTPTAAASVAAVAAVTCPHCGGDLKPHGDVSGALHCHSPLCVNCCFFPPDAEAPGVARERVGARYCKLRH